MHSITYASPKGGEVPALLVIPKGRGPFPGVIVQHGLPGTKEQLLATLQQVRDDAQEMLRFGGAVKQEFLDGRAVLQDQAYIRALAVDFFISLLATVDGWAERTLAEIEGWTDLSPDGKNDRGLEIFAQLPAPTPGEHTDRTAVAPRTQQRRRRSSGSSSRHRA